MPDRRRVQSALRTTTQRLAAELAQPGNGAPDWQAFEWRAAMAVAVMHGISARLAACLDWRGPAVWQDFLAEQALHGTRREARLRRLLTDLHGAAVEAGLPLVGLKGAALLRAGFMPPGQRPMSDIDLLVAPQQAERADRLIRALGYAPGVRMHRHVAYEPLQQPADRAFGEHEDNPIKIELHTGVAESLPRRPVDITGDLAAPDMTPGLHGYRHTAALMRHLLLHTTGNLCTRNVRLIQLHDLARVAPQLDAAGWADALAPSADGRPAWWAVPTLTLTAQLFPGTVPQPPRAAVQACPSWLRRASPRWTLADVSLSHLAIPWLPGAVWSQGPADLIGLAWQRLVPPERAATVQTLDRQHSLSGSAWTRLPTWRKALSFLRGAPPRAQTMYSLHRALAYRPTSSA